MATKIPEIPHNKTHHLFVCYEKNSLDIVRKIVDNLERNGLVCYYYDRDFLPGRSILHNIEYGIRKSLGMLIVLSEEFENSVYCMHEMDEAFNLKVREEYTLIPIKTEPCNVPERLKHLVYIDVEDDINDAHNKIIDAMIKKDMRDDLIQDQNGEWLQFDMKKHKKCRLSFSQYKLNFTDNDKAKIWQNNFQVSADLLHDVEETVNGSLFVRYFYIWRFSPLIISLLFLHLLIVILIIFLVLLITKTGREKADSFQPAGYALAIGLSLWALCGFSSGCLWFYHMYYWKGIYGVKFRARSMLMSKLWCLSKQSNAQTGVIFFISSTLDHSEIFKFNIMCYNLKKCKVCFASRLEKVEALKRFRAENETYEACTSRIFDDFMSNESPGVLLTPSITTRHKMKNNAKCLCLLAEEFLKAKRTNGE